MSRVQSIIHERDKLIPSLWRRCAVTELSDELFTKRAALMVTIRDAGEEALYELFKMSKTQMLLLPDASLEMLEQWFRR